MGRGPARQGDTVTRGPVERCLVGLGVPDHVARLLAATPALRLSWIGSAALALTFAVLAAYGSEGSPAVFLIVAPLLPIGGVAAAFGPGVDPTYEIGLASPMSTFRLVLIRTLAVLGTTIVLSAIAALALPGLDWKAVAWLLPSLALTIATLALATFVQPLWTAGIVASQWCAGVILTRAFVPDSLTVFRGPGQAVFFVMVAAGAPLVAHRRERLEMAERGSLLFRQYVSPDVVAELLRDPTHAALGGATVEVSVLFADLPGFTSFSERASPDEVVALLNRYYGDAAPIVLQEGGMVDKFVGDALMALFGAPVRCSDHALRAARAALRVQRAVEDIAAGDPTLPRFRIGVNSGPALVGNIGSVEVRNFTAIGDAVNLAQRLQSLASPGQVVIGPRTHQAIRAAAVVQALGPVSIKGREDPVEAFVLEGLRA